MNFLGFIVQGYIYVGNRGLAKKGKYLDVVKEKPPVGGIKKKKLWALRQVQQWVELFLL